MAYPHNSGSILRIIFTLHNKRGQEVHENFGTGSSEKILVQGKFIGEIIDLQKLGENEPE